MTELLEMGMDGLFFDDPKSVAAIQDYFAVETNPCYKKYFQTT
jgi:hypothetical protein